ncbi:hypothetical protein GALMADRAFT_245047 [Galerina marginata CBS 339.88]|uniref:Thioesterase domain-containing protein n=1 Tax=Galerina marginata (strain CBS 339.88) TaxID=685588 RepID=A0A067TGG9_GALM3|nr:hypothetical protein GALMADRAFT_245047 [Galerina marginata CBS 339.88]
MSSSQALVVTLDTLQSLARKLSLTSILRVAPKVGKALVCILFLLNIRSWPLVWHFRVFRPVYAIRLYHTWLRISGLVRSTAVKQKIEDQWLDSISPVGKHPLTMYVPYRSWASLDDSDFNGHLSNSSYPKILDSARFKAAVQMFPMFFRSGGWMALAATNFYFIREIPILSSYEIRSSLASWDQKWIYVMSRFVRKPSGKKKQKRIETKPISPEDSEVYSQTMSLRTPGPDGIPSNGTPAISDTPKINTTTEPDTQNALNAVAAGLVTEEPDGAILHTVAISQVCYKVGRITVPPSLVLGVNGFTGESGFSLSSPHPQWADAKNVMSIPNGGSPKKLKALFAGGWKDIPESERWWEQALGESVEAQRAKNLALIEGLRRGLENARSL